MIVCIAGTDTSVGKTLVSSWLCLHTGYDYFKPVQTGAGSEPLDRTTVQHLSQAVGHEESYVFDDPVSPHRAAQDQGQVITLDTISLPAVKHLIIESAGGVCTPLNDTCVISDLMGHFNVPVILVARSTVGTINHTILSLEHIKTKQLNVLGVIMSGPLNPSNKAAIEHYGQVPVLAELPMVQPVCYETLHAIPLPPLLQQVFQGAKQ